MRIEQPDTERGSQKWIQRFVNEDPEALNSLIRQGFSQAGDIEWLSPLRDDSFAEYRDKEFLQTLGLQNLSTDLKLFWPSRGPQWDGLATFANRNGVLLVEAKAHIGEVFSPPCGATDEVSRSQIQSALNETIDFIGATPKAPWISCFYQLANRLAHLYFLRRRCVDARLVLINFVGDTDVGGPRSQVEWEAAYRVVWHVLGVPKRHQLSDYIIEVFPKVC